MASHIHFRQKRVRTPCAALGQAAVYRAQTAPGQDRIALPNTERHKYARIDG